MLKIHSVFVVLKYTFGGSGNRSAHSGRRPSLKTLRSNKRDL
jgi:hypothetical protein